KVNGRKVSIPSFAVKVNDTIEVKDHPRSRQIATKNLESATSRAVPDWLSMNKDAFKGVVMRIPTQDEIHPIANVQAVVEFYSRLSSPVLSGGRGRNYTGLPHRGYEQRGRPD